MWKYIAKWLLSENSSLDMTRNVRMTLRCFTVIFVYILLQRSLSLHHVSSSGVRNFAGNACVGQKMIYCHAEWDVNRLWNRNMNLKCKS